MSILTQESWLSSYMFKAGSPLAASVLGRPIETNKADIGLVNSYLNFITSKESETYEKLGMYPKGYIVKFDGISGTQDYETTGSEQFVEILSGDIILYKKASTGAGTGTLDTYYKADSSLGIIDLNETDFTSGFTPLTPSAWENYISIAETYDKGNPPIPANIGTYWKVLEQTDWEAIFYFKDDADTKFVNADLPGQTETIQGSISINENLNVDGTTNLDDTNVVGTLDVQGTSTLDNTTIDGTLEVNSSTTINDDLTVNGNVTISGTTTTINTTEMTVSDNIITLNSDVTGTPSENAGIEVERGTETNTSIRWNETTDTWQKTSDGTNFYDIIDENELSDIINNGTQSGVTVTYDGNLNASVESINVSLSGEVTSDSVSIDHTGDVTITNVQITDFNERVEDVTGAMFDNGIHSNVNITYDDVAGNISVEVPLKVTEEVSTATLIPDFEKTDTYINSVDSDTTIVFPTTIIPGSTGTFIVKQDDIGNHSLTFEQGYIKMFDDSNLDYFPHQINMYKYTILDNENILLHEVTTIKPNITIETNGIDTLTVNGTDTLLLSPAIADTIINGGK